jgi:hypothetical protein
MRTRIIGAAAILILGAIAAGIFTDRPSWAQLGSASPVATAVTVGTTSVQLLAANGSRHGVQIYNQSANVLSVLPGTTAAVASAAGTINVAASGGMLVITCTPTFPCGNAFQGIASGASSAITVWEY